uniref:Major capsid protein N-terminal domain-containing protein n=1 Tax=viral metagenome TaxID=1070528 RepID=A0A6C0JYI3_9ZZZZ
MPGGLMQLVGKGAQDQLVTGNPSFTYFRGMYKRHSDFAMEHFRLYFRTKNMSLPPSGSLTLTAKAERYAQLLHDCYLSIQLPDIYSPVVSVPHGSPTLAPDATAIGYEFQWVRNIGYNLINYVAVTINGQEIVRHTGEWMKLYAHTKFDANKKKVLNELVGHVVEMYDPANAFDRMNQYPHSISTSSASAPSIAGRVLTIPLHFWFCESIGSALPLIALQHSEVDIVVDLKNIYQLYTVLDTDIGSPTFGTRIAPPPNITTFLSPPLQSTLPTNTALTSWNMNPFIEANYIFVSDAELAHIASTDHSFLVTQIDVRQALGQYGPSNDLELMLRNLCTRVIWVAQRNDRALQNDYDNYTNWVDPNKSPLQSNSHYMTPWYSAGIQESTGITSRDILLESAIILDGKERFNTKQVEFFSHIQNYRHNTGTTITELAGMYMYSFALDHDKGQPSGHINGSQFNKTILRNTYVEPPLGFMVGMNAPPNNVCVLKSTANNPNPTVVNPAAVDKQGNRLYAANDVVYIVQKTSGNTLAYTYNVRAFVESYNFLRVMSGIANVVFSS